MMTVGDLDVFEIVFPRLGIHFTIKDTAFTVFGIDIKWYGIIITAGLFLALLFGFSQMKRFGLNSDRAIDAVIAGIIGGLVGARVYYVAMSWSDYAGDWKSIFNIRNGGLAIYGGIIGACLVGGIVAKLRKVKLLPMLDIAGIGFLLGQGIGRWGNFVNQEAFGYNTGNLFGMSGGRIQQWIAENADTMDRTMDIYRPVHPCFLYESVWCLAGFLLLWLVSKKFRKYDGQMFLMYIAWYGLGRFFIEGLRTDSLYLGNIRVSQALAAICVIASVIIQVVMLFKVRREGAVLYCDTEESKLLLEENIKNTSDDLEDVESKSEDGESEEVCESETSDDTGISEKNDINESNDDIKEEN